MKNLLTFGFKVPELKNHSLRLLFGPQTDLCKLGSIVNDFGVSPDATEIVLYRKDGEEVRCSTQSNAMISTEGCCMIVITLKPECAAKSTKAGSAPRILPEKLAGLKVKVSAKLHHPAPPSSADRGDTLLEPHGFAFSPAMDAEILAHMQAIRRARKARRASRPPAPVP